MEDLKIYKLNNRIINLIHIIMYALVLFIISKLFKTIDIDNSYFGIYTLLASIIIYTLNKYIKPILFKLTIPLIGITMGLFYPCINIFILKITDYILGTHFQTHGIITLFFTVILISIINYLIESFLRKGDYNEFNSI